MECGGCGLQCCSVRIFCMAVGRGSDWSHVEVLWRYLGLFIVGFGFYIQFDKGRRNDCRNGRLIRIRTD